MTKSKVVILGSCSVDFTTYASRLPIPGETLHGNKFVTSFGGKGANQCVAAAKLGGNTYMIGRVGDDDWGTKYIQNMEKVGVNTVYLKTTPNVSTGIAQISVAEDGQNAIVIVPGANSYLCKDDLSDAKDLIENAEILIAQLETPFETTLEAFKLCKGIKLLNAAPAQSDIQELLPHCTILCVNECEASMLTGIEVNIENAQTALNKLLDTGCETIIITLGEKGAIFASRKNKQPVLITCEPVTAVDTTGAGDAFVGALATFLVTYKDYSLDKIIDGACKVATISVTKEGTQTSYPTNYNPFKE